MYDRVVAGITESVRSISPEALWGEVQGAAEAFRQVGLMGATYVRLGHPLRGLKPGPEFGLALPERWTSTYVGHPKNVDNIITSRLLRSPYAFTWSEAEESEGTTQSAAFLRDLQMICPDMLVCPLPTSHGQAACVGLWMSEPRKFREEEKAVLQSLATLYATLGRRRLTECRVQRMINPTLSQRELECVYWVSQGRSDIEIAETLDLSASTVHHHVERAKRKFEAKTRVELMHAAFERGMIMEPAVV